jgi:hydroxymethylpyrimidine/phosphomethylpyrimidine kinase
LQAAVVVTAVTAQNERKFIVSDVVSPSIFSQQMKAIGPMGQFMAVKIGMLGDEGIVEALAHLLRRKHPRPPVVLDPVIQSTTGGSLLSARGRQLLLKRIVRHVSLWTPNLSEASFFSGVAVRTETQMVHAANVLFKKTGVPIYIKGKRSGAIVKDLFFDGKRKRWLIARHLKTRGRVRGKGCALSTFFAVRLALGHHLLEAIRAGRADMDQWLRRQTIVKLA